ncbi:MAG TPA: DMT family transporter [Candidatus Marinimicrobia bacterium]|nr:DMT family transporter [Candidatus Neomarinimicrobiota bacterium]
MNVSPYLVLKSRILLLMATFFWGLTFIYVKEGTAITGVWSFLAWRFIIAAMLLLIIFLRRFRNLSQKTLIKGFFMGLLLAASYLFQTIGLQTSTVAKAAFITGLFVVFIPFFTALTSDHKPTKRQYLAAFISFFGLAVMAFEGYEHISAGDLWVLACAVSFAIYVVWVSYETPKHDSIQITTIQLFTVGIVSAIGIIPAGNMAIPLSLPAWEAILFCAVFATTFSYTIENHYQKFISETEAGIIYSLEPVFAAGGAWILLSEMPALKVWIGAALILAGMLSSISKKDGHQSTIEPD